MYIPRQLESKIKPFLKRKEIITILGPRQSGKTTFLKHLQKELEDQKKKVKFISFENRKELALFNNDIDDFKDLYSDYDVIIIDEFQYAKEGGQKLKYLFDSTKIKYIISGSSSLELNFQIGKYLVGRMVKFNLWPFSFREYLSYADKDLSVLLEKRLPNVLNNFDTANTLGLPLNEKLGKLLEKYLIYGGYPAVVLAKTQDEKRKILESIFENYLLKDINSILQLATEDELIRLIKFLAAQIGNLIAYTELSNASGLTYHNLLKHLEILKQTYVIDLIKPYFTNKRIELAKNPKPYFIDLGLRNFSISDFRPIDSRVDKGSMAENFVFDSLIKQELFFESIKFWRTKSSAEMDFVISKNAKQLPIEVKYSNEPPLGKSVYSYIEKFSPKELIIFTNGKAAKKKIKNTIIKYIPIYYL